MRLVISVLLLLALLPVQGASASAPSGSAVYYSKGLMERVYAKRVAWGQIKAGTPHYDGYAATVNCPDIGKYIYVSLQNPQTKTWSKVERLLIVDCSAPADRARHIANHQLVEVDYETAQRAGFIKYGRTKVTVLLTK